ncbi:MAG: hypothetical protein KAI57_00795 [Candidatus Pacebacteria bacterium]|nr:hypothetical protein [Candidatus Paceibacterota bacterium]
MAKIFSPLGLVEKRKLWTAVGEYEVGIFITSSLDKEATTMFVEINLSNVFLTIAKNKGILLVDVSDDIALMLVNNKEVFLIKNTSHIVKFALNLSGPEEHYHEGNRGTGDTEKKFTLASQRLLRVAHNFITIVEIAADQLEKDNKTKNNGGQRMSGKADDSGVIIW